MFGFYQAAFTFVVATLVDCPAREALSVAVLTIVTYNPEIIIPSFNIAWQDIQDSYPSIQFNYTMATISDCNNNQSSLCESLAKFHADRTQHELRVIFGAGTVLSLEKADCDTFSV